MEAALWNGISIAPHNVFNRLRVAGGLSMGWKRVEPPERLMSV
jgi:hypothetical protein